MPSDELGPQQVHIWHAFLPQHGADLEASYLQLLSDQERLQHGKFYFEKDRHRYLVTRALVRTVLSRYAPVDPKDWLFGKGQHGRPTITNQHPLAQRIRFNVSHTDSLVVLAVTTGREVGIDTENTLRTAPLEVADRFFSTREAQSLRLLPAEDQPLRFWEYWTFKESYIKARSMGLSLPLAQFSFDLSSKAEVAIAFDGIDDNPATWQFWQYRPDAHHLVAVCLERTDGKPVAFSFWRVQPLGMVGELEVATTRRSSM